MNPLTPASYERAFQAIAEEPEKEDRQIPGDSVTDFSPAAINDMIVLKMLPNRQPVRRVPDTGGPFRLIWKHH